MAKRITRRQFQQTVGLGTALAMSSTVRGCQAIESVRIGCIGVGGKGGSDMTSVAPNNQIVAICDIDEKRLASAAAKFPKAKKYTDWRKLLEQKDIDAVTVSTPDHTHAPATLAALKLGKHVYTQKPLTHSVSESRALAEAAKEAGVVTQMGIQHHSSARLQNAVQIVHDGVIGKVSEVHTWTDRPGRFWRQGLERPKNTSQPPKHIHWNQWLGVAPERPYVANVYHPFHWRGWWDFGTGALGDMGCHILDPVFSALKLGAPSLITAKGPKPHPESGPLSCVVDYTFPGTKFTKETVKVVWYEAGLQPSKDIMKAPKDWKGSMNGVLFIGEKGNLFVGFPEPPQLFPVADFADYKMPTHDEKNHYQQWTNAIKGTDKVTCPFSYSGPLTEAVLLGNVAYRSEEAIQWDSKSLQAKGSKKAAQYIARDYRAGW